MQITGIVNSPTTLQQNQSLKSMASSGSASTADSASIGANDFLTLLVTEMQNQDPTANTDPNEYINQLVQVNSLEQLISINQTLQTDSTPTTDGNASAQQITSTVLRSVGPAGSQRDSAHGDTPQQPVSGNLSIPNANDSAVRVAHALTTQ